MKKWTEKVRPDGHVASAEHQVRFATVAQGVKVEVLDWGGGGEPVVLLAGLLLTAHAYDDFASALTDRFHVYGITRRGFGASSQPASGYDMTTRMEDLRSALDILHLDRVSLVGHSQAGDELTWFAGAYPDRVARLVYLDAAHDHSGLGEWTRTHGFWPDQPPPPATAWRIWNGCARAGPPDYTRVQSPALAIYAIPESAADIWPDAWHDGNAATREWIQKTFGFWQTMVATKADFAKALHGRTIEIPRASHMLFISDREEVLRHTREFLLLGR